MKDKNRGYMIIKLERKRSEPSEPVNVVYSYSTKEKKPVFKDEKFAERMKEFGIGILENGNRQLYKLNDEGFHQAFVQTYSKWFDANFFEFKVYVE